MDQSDLDSETGESSPEEAAVSDLESEQSPDEDAGSSDLESEESSDEDDDHGAGFFDMEAEESSDGSDGSDETSVFEPAFGRFMQLPPELRARVWEMFCPDLVARGRVLAFPPRGQPDLPAYWGNQELVLNFVLEEQTRALRHVMAVHRESRRLALVAFPHVLQVKADINKDEKFPFHFNQTSDILIFEGPHLDDGHHRSGIGLLFDSRASFISDAIFNYAIDEINLHYAGIEKIHECFTHFPKLKRLYVYSYNPWFERRFLWTASDYVHTYQMETREMEPGLGEDTQTTYYRPDIDRYPDIDKRPEFEAPFHFRGLWIKELTTWVRNLGAEVWPLAMFTSSEYHDRFLAKRDHLELGDGSDEGASHDVQSLESSTDSSEYESEGIDDGSLNDDSDDGDEEEVIYRSEGDSQGEDNEDDDDDDDDGRLQAAGEPLEARFSSPELDEQEAEEPARRPPKRKIVIDSDDEEGEEGDRNESTGPRAKRLRVARHIVADSDSDSNSDEGVARVAVEPDGQSSGRGASLTRREHQPPAEEDDSSNSDGDSSDGSSDSSDRTDNSDSSDGVRDSDSGHGTDDGDSVEDDDHQDDDEGDCADEDGDNDMMSEGSEDF